MTAALTWKIADPVLESRPMLVAQRSRHRIRPFRLHRPKTAEEAVALHVGSDGAAAYMGGGIDIIAALKSGMMLADVIHLGALPDRPSIVEREDVFAIGAGVTHRGLAESKVLCANYPGLCEGWSALANNRIRSKGTLAGNLMADNPLYDFSMAAVAAGAGIDYLDASRARGRLAIEGISGLPPRALITNILFPRERPLAFAVQLQWKPAIAFAVSFRREQGAVTGRLAVGCGYRTAVSSTVRLEHDLFDELARETPADIAEQLCHSLPPPLSDWRASSDYRRHILKVLVRREIERIRAVGPGHEG